MTTFENSNGWDVCQPGEVGAVVRRLKSRRRTARLQAVGSMAALMIGIGFLGYYLTTVSPAVDQYYAGISCTEMTQLASRYVSGQLDAEKMQQIRDHLARCRRCHERYEAMQTPDKPAPRTSIDNSRRHHALNVQPTVSPVVAAVLVLSVVEF